MVVLWSDLKNMGQVIAEPIAEGVLRLSESALLPEERSYFYLLSGTRQTCLIDGGWGIARAPIADLAIATHSHFDHIGHIGQVVTRLAHPAEASIFALPDPVETQAAPFLDQRLIMPGGGTLNLASFAQTPCPLTGYLADGDVVDLGGRQLRVFHTPGHSPGSISLLDSATGILFAGDVLLEGHIYDDVPGADPAALLASHRRILQLPFRLICGGHGAALSRSAAQERAAAYAASRVQQQPTAR